VDYLLRNLTNLEYLNGLAVERDALFNEEEDEEEEQESRMHHNADDIAV
jgi:hypothetical protein